MALTLLLHTACTRLVLPLPERMLRSMWSVYQPAKASSGLTSKCAKFTTVFAAFGTNANGCERRRSRRPQRQWRGMIKKILTSVL